MKSLTLLGAFAGLFAAFWCGFSLTIGQPVLAACNAVFVAVVLHTWRFRVRHGL